MSARKVATFELAITQNSREAQRCPRFVNNNVPVYHQVIPTKFTGVLQDNSYLVEFYYCSFRAEGNKLQPRRLYLPLGSMRCAVQHV